MKNKMKLTFPAFLMALAVSLTVALSANSAQAWISNNPIEKPYNFKFHMKQETFTYTQSAPSYEEAFEKAAQACYRHFKGGRQLSEETGLDIIDICANPRTI